MSDSEFLIVVDLYFSVKQSLNLCLWAMKIYDFNYMQSVDKNLDFQTLSNEPT